MNTSKSVGNERGKVTVVVGGQLGSEGKGTIVKHIADEYHVHIRVGGCNAGHSFYHKGVKHVVQSVPIGWTNPSADLFLGAGAVVSPKILLDELEKISQVDPTVLDRLHIDGNATIITDKEHNAEGGVNGELHQRIGSTGEGVGAARLARLRRDPTETKLARDIPELQRFVSEDTILDIDEAIRMGRSVLVEGTQGSGLSLVHGPWPYCTTADTNASGIIADVGLSPRVVTDIIMVVRTFPIRVAGNSGPLENEVSWEYISSRVGRPVTEKTTVTKKTRRVGLWDNELFLKSVVLNKPTAIAINFMDYIDPDCEGTTSFSDLSEEAQEFVANVEDYSGVPVQFIGTGGPQWSIVDRRVPVGCSA